MTQTKMKPELDARISTAAEEKKIRALFDRYVAHFLAGDGERWITLFDRKAVWMAPGEPMMDFEQFVEWAMTLRPGHADAFTNENLEIEIMGDWAFATGTYKIDGPTGDGKGYHFDGKFLDILKRQHDGSWKIYRCAFNLNTP